MTAVGEERHFGEVRRRAPALPVAVAFVTGIVADAHLPTVGWAGWACAATALILALLMRSLRCSRASAVCLLIAVAGMGAVRHHDVWFVGRPNNVGLLAREEPRPARIIGTITERPQLIRESDEESSRPWGSRERSVLAIDRRREAAGTR